MDREIGAGDKDMDRIRMHCRRLGETEIKRAKIEGNMVRHKIR